MKIHKCGTIVDKDPINVLGIESSCDDTSIAIVNSNAVVLSNVVKSHVMSEYGGVVPEFAARSHIDCIKPILLETLAQAQMQLSDIDVIGFTQGPGLIGGLIVSTIFGKVLSSALRIPMVAVNHLEGHIFSPALNGQELPMPFLALLITGGHSQFILVRGIDSYHTIGGTLDDAVGEAFDKVARMLGFGYPGGPVIEERAKMGSATAFTFPRPMLNDGSCNFSCSGLKTAVKLTIDRLGPTLTGQTINDICASFQASIADILVNKMCNALKINAVKSVAIVGGVASNAYIKLAIESSINNDIVIRYPARQFCSDNAAMIALAAYYRCKRGHFSGINVAPDPSLGLRQGSNLYRG